MTTSPDFRTELARLVDLYKVALDATPPPEPPTVMEALAARPLLEQVARLGDCIGANTVGKIMAISSRAAAWLEANPPGQPVAIEPRGCPTPGACSCVEPATPPPGQNTKPRFLNICIEGPPPAPYENWEDWGLDTFKTRTIQGVYIRALISGDFSFDKKEVATPPPEPPTELPPTDEELVAF